MTVVEQIITNAEKYPEREAIVSADGTVVLYGDIAKHLPNVTEYEHTTSGTTNPQKPKQIIITDDNLQRRLVRLEVLRPALKDVQKLLVPIARSTPLYVQLRSYLLLNGKTLFDGSGPAAVMAMCEQYAVDGSVFIPKNPMFSALMDVGSEHRFDHVFVSGAAADDALFAQIASELGTTLHVNYAASEVGQIAGADYAEIVNIQNCVGRVAPGVLVEIVKDGSLRIQCDTMVHGYTNDPQMTKVRFYDGFFYPGDVGYFDGEFLIITGRA